MNNDKVKQLSDEQITSFLKQHYNVSNVNINKTKKWGVLCSTFETAKEGEDKINLSLYDDSIFVEIAPIAENLELSYLRTMLEYFENDDEYVKLIMNKLLALRNEETARHKRKMEELDASEKYLFGDTLESLAKAGAQVQPANAESAEQTSVFDSGEQLTINETQNQPQ